MPLKFKRCVSEVKRSEMRRYGRYKYNPYAVCRVSTGYYGSTVRHSARSGKRVARRVRSMVRKMHSR